MKKYVLIYMMILCFLIGCFSGCSTQPPSFHQVENLYLQNESDFCAVVDYIAGLSAESAHVSTDTLNIRVDFTEQQIDNPRLSENLQHLRKAGCSSIFMNRSDNSIIFVIWKTELVGDAEAGILYAIESDESNPPTTQYLTELQPLPIAAWYYYVADYEEWRQVKQGTGH